MEVKNLLNKYTRLILENHELSDDEVYKELISGVGDSSTVIHVITYVPIIFNRMFFRHKPL